MPDIRTNTILSSASNYMGYIIGLANIFFFVNVQYFTPAEYGLTRIFIDIGTLVFSVVNFGMLNTMLKFSPIYQRHYPQSGGSELLRYSLIMSHIGFLILLILGLFFRDSISAYFSIKSPLFNEYYIWLAPYCWGVILFTTFEIYLYTLQKAFLVSIFKDILQRLLILIFIVLLVFNFYNVDVFLKLFAFVPLMLFIVFVLYFLKTNSLSLSGKVSGLTKKLKSKLIPFSLFNYGAFITITLAATLDSFFIIGFSKNGLTDAGVFTFSGFIISFIQVPQKYLNNIASIKIYDAMQIKNTKEVQRIYYRSSLNLYIFGLLILLAILLGFDALFGVFKINHVYQQAKLVIIILGIGKLFDLLTSVNLHIIIGSKYWKYDFYFNIFLLLVSIPFNYFLIKKHGILGAAYSNLFVMIIINTSRSLFIWIKLRIHPLHINFLWITLLASLLFFGLLNVPNLASPLLQLFFKPALFVAVFIFFIYFLKLTPDLNAIVKITLNKIKK